MRRNNIWMRYLILGLVISLIITLNSCKDHFFSIVGEYQFVNETNYSVTYSSSYEKFNVAPNSAVVIMENGRGSGKEGIREADFVSPLFSLSSADILTIKFDQTRCLTDVKVDDKHSVRNIKNFRITKMGNNHYKFTYTFTEEDYNRAMACQ